MKFGMHKDPPPKDEPSSYAFTREEIDLLSECIRHTQEYYEGLLLLKEGWNKDQNEQSAAMIKTKLYMLQKLQDRTSYMGQADIYK